MRQAQPRPDEVNALLALYNARRYAEAESRILALLGQYPDFGFGWRLLGMSLHMQGKDPLHALQKSAYLLPDDADVHNNLANALNERGQFDAAAASFRRALKIKPDFVEAHNNLGIALINLRQFDDAASCFRRAIELKSSFAEGYSNLGYVLKELGQPDKAVTSCRRALKLKPDFADAHNNLGNALKALGQLKDAVTSYRRAGELKPNFAEAHYNMGVVQQELGQINEAVTSYRRAIQIKPNYAQAHYNLGIVLLELGQLNDAIASYRKSLEINPDFAEAHNNLGTALLELGQFDAALASYRRALEIKPEYAEAHSNLLFTLHYTDHPPEYYLSEAREYGRRVNESVTSRFSAWQCSTQPQRLRVGMVSGDLRNHPVGYFVENLLTQLDPARIELIAYSINNISSPLTARIKPYFAAWKTLSGLNDEAAARLIHADGIHILLDLSGHAGKNRLPVFAWKPAPVQASWMGYWASTGMSEIDYFLADEVGVPEAQRANFSETVWYLPDTRLCFTPPEVDIPVASLPALNNGYITFGCFQNLSKVGNEVLLAWSNILRALPNAQLRWQCKQLGDLAAKAQFVERLKEYGIEAARVRLYGSVPRETYLAAHAEVDVLLDTFPYTGGTTTCEALWMGVPTLTLAGNTLLSRQGVSLLTAAGLEEWVATSVEEYIAKAVALPGDLPRLAALRAGLRKQVSASPLYDAKRFAKNFEAALWGMWQAQYQRSKSVLPKPLTVSSE